MFWYQNNLGTCGYYEYKDMSAKKNPELEFIIVWDLIDGYQNNWGQFESKIRMVEKSLKQGKKVIVVCRGGMSRSNAVVLSYLLKSGMRWNEAYNIIRKNPESRIEMNLLSQIKRSYAKNKVRLTKDIGQSINKRLREKRINLNYDHKKNLYTTWHKVPFKVNFRFGKSAGLTDMIHKRINITADGKSLDDDVAVLLHEIGHADIYPFDIILLAFGFMYVFVSFINQFNYLFLKVIVSIICIAVYVFFINELIVELYRHIRYRSRNK